MVHDGDGDNFQNDDDDDDINSRTATATATSIASRSATTITTGIVNGNTTTTNNITTITDDDPFESTVRWLLLGNNSSNNKNKNCSETMLKHATVAVASPQPESTTTTPTTTAPTTTVPKEYNTVVVNQYNSEYNTPAKRDLEVEGVDVDDDKDSNDECNDSDMFDAIIIDDDDDDDASSIMSDVGLLYEIDFRKWSSSSSSSLEYDDSNHYIQNHNAADSDDDTHNNNNQNSATDNTTTTTTAAATATRIRMRRKNRSNEASHNDTSDMNIPTKHIDRNGDTTLPSRQQQQQLQRGGDRPSHDTMMDHSTATTNITTTTTKNDKRRRSKQRILDKELRELEMKLQQRQLYLQQLQQPYNVQNVHGNKHHGRPWRLLQPIQHREGLSSTIQRNQMLHKFKRDHHQNTVHATATMPRTIANHPPGPNNDIMNDKIAAATAFTARWWRDTILGMYNGLIFEYYMTTPAVIVIVFHSIIMVMFHEFVLLVIHHLYSDLLPTLYDNVITTMTIQPYQQLQSLWIPLSRIVAALPLLTSLLARATYYMELYYDTLFYVGITMIGLYMLHYSGYLYWWLSDYDYTIMKLDTRNRIRLLKFCNTINTKHTNGQFDRHHQPFVENVATMEPTTSNDTSTAISTMSFPETATPRRLPNQTVLTGWNNNRNSFMNTFVRRFSIIRRYPILRLLLYLMGYYTLYMISQIIIATTYPYFSQHNSILAHLPSKTFDKPLYQLVADDSTTISSVSSNSNIFPCLAQSCHNEIVRQQHANQELIQIERHYTLHQLAHMSYHDYWSMFVQQFGVKSSYPLFDTLRNRYYIVEEDDDDEDDDDEEFIGEKNKEMEYEETDIVMVKRSNAGAIVDFDSTSLFSNVGEAVFGFILFSIGVVLLRAYGFIFWEKY